MKWLKFSYSKSHTRRKKSKKNHFRTDFKKSIIVNSIGWNKNVEYGREDYMHRLPSIRLLKCICTCVYEVQSPFSAIFHLDLDLAATGRQWWRPAAVPKMMMMMLHRNRKLKKGQLEEEGEVRLLLWMTWRASCELYNTLGLHIWTTFPLESLLRLPGI